MSSLAWCPADRDYEIAIDGKKLVCRNPKGKQLASLPKWLKDSETAEQMRALADWLASHRENCLKTVTDWMLRSLTIPRPAVVEIWQDADWRNMLENLVVVPADARGKPDHEATGILRDVDGRGRLGVVNLDGESVWISAANLAVPHPIVASRFLAIHVSSGHGCVVSRTFYVYNAAHRIAVPR